MGRLDNAVAVITGGAGGIGKAIVQRFVAEGARVVIADIDEQHGTKLAQELGNAALFYRTDVRREADIEAALALAVEKFGTLDCLCSSADTIPAMKPVEDVPLEGAEYSIDVSLRGAFFGMKHAGRIMKPRGTGTIINIASIAGFYTGFGSHMYSAAKAGVIALSRSVAMELGESGIRVNCICPAAAITPLGGRTCDLHEEEAEAALWLASDDARCINGHALVLDGGVTCGRSWSTALHETQELKQALGLGG
ncbi:MAG TPA: SDR family oxidoreductase [Thermodesulfobacteriota bacterium]|nr:SDR family oxidoreductase [Thermodesulfobacteriota bacterium]